MLNDTAAKPSDQVPAHSFELSNIYAHIVKTNNTQADLEAQYTQANLEAQYTQANLKADAHADIKANSQADIETHFKANAQANIETHFTQADLKANNTQANIQTFTQAQGSIKICCIYHAYDP
ncbi:hypothetical protein ACHAW5_001664 [Stephanodiscus triporus]|uniref:Uncharacterized protein n=1 Tax=Stephanodiscus triporus TaxID=2934178 RepID=A0ABD3N5H0_9STRA